MSEPRVGPRIWARDLAMGVKFAAGGGRESWARTLLTAVGVGVGVAMLLLAASVPAALITRSARDDAREPAYDFTYKRPADAHTLLLRNAGTTFRTTRITGLLVRPDGADPGVPPGLGALPGPGEMAVSPALRTLLAAPGSALLRQRLPYKVVATIGDRGLSGPQEMFYYAGDPHLTSAGFNAARVTHWGIHPRSQATDAILVLLMVVAVVALLVPVGVFIGAAVRFGGERRDRRLAALRLVGADRRTTSRIAGGESAFGALLGLVVGGAVFLAARSAAAGVSLFDLSVFPSDLTPQPVLTALIAVAVPLSAVIVTLLALRRVSIEPLGVVRSATPRRRRLIWRLALPLLGAALLFPLAGGGSVHGTLAEWQVGTGVALLLIGLTALLPWLVEATVRRLGGAGPLGWQLACRRLQLTPGSAARMVSGITVAVAGAIAVMTLMNGVSAQYTHETGHTADPDRISADFALPDHTDPGAVLAAFRETPGVATLTGDTSALAAPAAALAHARAEFNRTHKPDPVWNVSSYQVQVAGCRTLERLTAARDCRPGSVYLVNDSSSQNPVLRPGSVIDLNMPDGMFTSLGAPRTWTVPAGAQSVKGQADPTGEVHYGLLATPQALPVSDLRNARTQVYASLAHGSKDAVERFRNTAMRFDPSDPTMLQTGSVTSTEFTTLRRGLLAGAVAVLVLIGASLLVSVLEQLRERKRLLAVLVAFGTRRTTMGASVLWQTAVPVALGLLLATAGGLGLGGLLAAISRTPGSFDWAGVFALLGAGATVVLAVTVLTLPALWRLMRPDGLRTE